MAESSKQQDSSDRSDGSSEGRAKRALRPSGGFRGLRSFRTAAFCERFVDRRSRTIDQMVQAARSGRQNIAEGSRASGTSSQTELRLIGVARASLDELLLDYEDFLRQHHLRQWGKDEPEAREVRAVGKTLKDRSDPTDPTDQSDAAAYAKWLQHRDPAVVANTLLCLIHQANYLLDQQKAALERDFISDGGYTERLAAARLAERERQREDQTDPPDQTDRPKAKAPACPLCGKPLVVRTARKGPHAGSKFWGCSGYPACRGACSKE